ncbi:uncharacterized protein ACR2FA_001225 [Aphomia sociella]
MASTYEDTVFNFDLDFLHQTSKNTGQSKLEKQRKAVAIAKQKTIATDSLIRKYYHKKEILEHTEKSVFDAKEECKQICIDYKNALERCTKLENDIHILENTNKELDQKYHNSENHYNALQSHTKQLQILAKENETLVESLKIENQLEKSNAKSCEKKATLLEKENDSLHKFFNVFKEVLLGKKGKGDHNFFNEISEEDISDNETYAYDNLMSPHPTEDDLENHVEVPTSSTIIPIEHEISLSRRENSIYKNDETDRCSEYSNEVASADTGRGSSLAFSDSEKCFHSPDYCSSDIPVKNIIDKSKRNLVSVATSPIPFEELSSFALMSNVPSIPKITVDKGVSPIKNVKQAETTDLKTIPMQLDDNTVYPAIGDNLEVCQQDCLEINGSNNFHDDNSRDCEIESIFNAMRFNKEFITPIPRSPAKSHDTVIRHISCGTQTNHSKGYVCEEAERVREENKILHSNIADLANEIMKIKSLLKNHPILSVEKDSEKEKEIVEINEDSHSNDEICEEYVIVIESEDASPNPCLPFDNDLCTSNSIQSKDSDEITQDRDLNKENYEPSPEPNNISLSKLEFEEAVSSVDDIGQTELDNKLEDNLEDSIITELNNNNNCSEITPINESPKRITRTRKLTKLEKLRKKMLPRSKIGKEIQLSKKACLRAKKLLQSRKVANNNISNREKSALDESSSVSLNDKTAYEKALKVMSELNSKQAEKFKQAIKTRQTVKTKETDLNQKNVETELCDLQKNVETELCDLQKISKCDKQQSNEINDKSMSELNSEQPEKFKQAIKTRQTVKSKETDLNQQNVETEMCDLQKISKYEKQQSNEINDKSKSELNSKQAEKFKQAIKTRPTVKSKEPDLNQQNVETEMRELQKISKCDKQTSNEINDKNSPQSSDRTTDSSITTRSRSKCIENIQILELKDIQKLNNVDNNKTNNEELEMPSPEKRKRLKRLSVDKPDVACKRILRSDTNRRLSVDNITSPKKLRKDINSFQSPSRPVISEQIENPLDITIAEESNRCISYEDMELFTDMPNETQTQKTKSLSGSASHPRESILCHMINKYNITVVKHQAKKVPDTVTNSICKTIEDSIAQIINLPPNETKDAMDVLVDTLQNTDIKEFMSGFVKYLQNPQRKIELFTKVSTPPAPPMTKAEQILLYIITHLKNSWTSIDVVDCVLNNMEYLLFKLNRTPEFDVIESTSHFYAILCRYFQLKTRLRVFVMDALYCMQYKAIALIKQCLDVWMHILPLAHMGIAKSPLVTCLVYVMHFYKCEDAFNRVKDIRFILNRRYSYHMVEWNETKMLEMFKNAIIDLRNNSAEKKILRMSLILLAKRQGPKWCQKNIITNMLQPIIEKDAPERIKTFCVAMLGPLLKPYPVDMKVHCEIVMNQLLDMLKHNPTQQMQEAIYTSLIYMSKHNQNRVIQAMLRWFPKSLSPECEEVLRDFVRDKPAKIWKTILSKISLIDDEQCNSLIS